VLRSPGQPLDPATRAYFEPRFGRDLGAVRVHVDGRAAESARAVGALAYTVGRDVVFGAGQHAPGSYAGQRLLAHELVHVVQQGGASGPVERIDGAQEPGEVEAERVASVVLRGGGLATSRPVGVQCVRIPTLSRRVVESQVRCTASTDNAPDDPVGELRAADEAAQVFSASIQASLRRDAEAVRAGRADPSSPTLQSYQTNFGTPPGTGSGFLNRLTGSIRPTQAIAMSEEVEILSRRFGLVNRLLSQTIHYVCPGGRAASFGGCSGEAGECSDGDAFSCRDVGAIFLCPSFWDFDPNQRASVLIHEAFHIVLGPSNPSQQGEIGDTTTAGSGRNFNIAGCYEQIVPDVFTFDSVATCPPPP
jgi:hypothetical protein